MIETLEIDHAKNQVVLTEIEIFPVKPKNGLVAFASFVFENSIFIGNVAVHSRPDGSGFRLVYPEKTLPNGKTLQIIYPITKAVGQAIEEAVGKRLEEVAGKSGLKREIRCFWER